MESQLKPTEAVVEDFGKIAVDIASKKESGHLYITNGRLLIYDESNNTFLVNFDPPRLQDTKLQQKKSKDNPPSDTSNAMVRIVDNVAKQNITITFTGKACNSNTDKFVSMCQDLKKAPPLPEPSQEEQESQPLTLRLTSDLIDKNKTLHSLLMEAVDMKVLYNDTFTNYQLEVINFFTKHRSKTIGYSSKDQWQLSQRADTTSGANVSKYSLDEQTIRQIFRRHPEFHQKYKSLKTQEEKDKFFNVEFIEHIHNYNDVTKVNNLSDIDIEHFTQHDIENRFNQVESMTRLDMLGDSAPYMGVFNKDFLKPSETITLNDVMVHSELVMMELGATPDISEHKGKELKYKYVPIEKLDTLTKDLTPTETTTYSPFSMNSELLYQQEYEPPAADDWKSAVSAFDVDLQNTQLNFEQMNVDSVLFKSSLVEMTIDDNLYNDYDVSALQNYQVNNIISMSKYLTELEALAFTYWRETDRQSKEPSNNIDVIKAKIEVIKTKIEDFVRSSQDTRLLNGVMDSLQEIITPILSGTYAKDCKTERIYGFRSFTIN